MESEPFHTDCLGKPFASDKMTETNPFHSIRIFHWFAYERLSLCNVEATQVNIGNCMQREVVIVITGQRSTGLYCLQATAGRQGQSWPEGRLSGEKKPPSQGPQPAVAVPICEPACLPLVSIKTCLFAGSTTSPGGGSLFYQFVLQQPLPLLCEP